MISIGVDTGANGAFAGISGETVWAFPLPQTSRGLDFSKLDAVQFLGCPVWLEIPPGIWPDAPAVAAFRFGRNFGDVRGWLHGIGAEVHEVTPAEWTARIGVQGKTSDINCQQRAAKLVSLYPSARSLIYGPRGGVLDGLVDALFIAHYGQLSLAAGRGEVANVKRWAKRQPKGLFGVDPANDPTWKGKR